jgi:hypothetical protein
MTLKTEIIYLTMHMDAHIMLKPLHSNGALLDKNRAEMKQKLLLYCIISTRN